MLGRTYGFDPLEHTEEVLSAHKHQTDERVVDGEWAAGDDGSPEIVTRHDRRTDLGSGDYSSRIVFLFMCLCFVVDEREASL